MIEAIVGNSFDQVGFGVLYFFMINAKPFDEGLLHDIFRIGLATEQIIGDPLEQRLIECNYLCLVQNVMKLMPQRYA